MEKNLNNFKNYCEKYKNTFSPLHSAEKHTLLVKRIFQTPEIIDLRRIQFKYKEVGLIGKDKPGRIDLVFIDDEEIPYICEMKASSKPGRGIEAQLKRYYDWVGKEFEIAPTRISIQLTETGKLKKKIIPVEIEDVFKLISKNNGENQNEKRIF